MQNSGSFGPVAGTPAVVGHGQYLHDAVDFPIDDAEAEHVQADAADVRWPDHARAARHFAGQCDGGQEFAVVTSTEPFLLTLVSRDLIAVLGSGFRV